MQICCNLSVSFADSSPGRGALVDAAFEELGGEGVGGEEGFGHVGELFWRFAARELLNERAHARAVERIALGAQVDLPVLAVGKRRPPRVKGNERHAAIAVSDAPLVQRLHDAEAHVVVFAVDHVRRGIALQIGQRLLICLCLREIAVQLRGDGPVRVGGRARFERGAALQLRRGAGRPLQVQDLPTLETLLGRRLHISPSQLEKYYTCRYGYFLQYVLGLKPRKRAELSADQSGTLMHWVLQMALDPHPGPDNPMAALQPFMELDDEAMASLAALLVDEYAKRYLPEDTARFAYLLSRLKKSMTSLLCYLRDEQRQSSFRPVACELKIGRGEDSVPGQTYHLSDGRMVQLIGTVDRADEWVEEDGTRWVRVVDYKLSLIHI